MKLSRTKIPDALLIEIEPHGDERGYFARTYCWTELRNAEARFGTIRQVSISFNPQRGTLRGMHWQAPAQPEAKIVRVSSGRIFDVIADLRRDSPAYGQWYGVELGADRQNAVLIPAGCAHGFLTLEDDCAVDYFMDSDYVPELALGFRWDDLAFRIEWPFAPTLIGERDKTWPGFVR